MSKFVCDRCGAPSYTCYHSSDPDYALQDKESFDLERVIIRRMLGLSLVLCVVTLWLVLR